MSINTQAIGKRYPPVVYAVGREKIKEYAHAVGETNPLHTDHEAARAAGHADVVAPPMFAVVYAGRAVAPLLFGGVGGVGPLVIAGDEITTTTSVREIAERGGMGFYVFESVSVNQRSETVCTGTWRNIVR